MRIITLIGLCFAVTLPLFAQYQIGLIPRVSPDKKVYQKIGYTAIEIAYGSPSMQQRNILGNLIPYQEIWRAGANNATTISISHDIQIDGNTLKAGKYAFFVMAQKTGPWTLIFNRQFDQWGAFDYNETQDVLRIEVTPEALSSSTESLTYSISSSDYQSGQISLSWGHIRISIPFKTNYLPLFQEEVESRASKADANIQWVVYLQGAEFLVDHKWEIDLAGTWLDKSEMGLKKAIDWNEQYYPKDYIEGHLYWTKAKWLALQKKYKEAVVYAEKMKSLEAARYYNRNQQRASIDTLVQRWRP